MLQKSLPISDFLSLKHQSVLFDVRSPKEFVHGHIPGAISFPLFTDVERHQVGLCYKQKGREHAILLGLELVGPKLATFVKEAKQIAQNKPILMYCWRGGMRSNSMALLLSTAGFRVTLLQHGYKAYRTWALSTFDKPLKLINLGGYTGTGKTEILKHLQQLGHQVVDLEEMAGHQGSAFGNLSLTPQPTTEQFENNLALILSELDSEKPVFIEDESMAIGQIRLPNSLYKTLQKGPLFFLLRDKNMRLKHIAAHYGASNKEAAMAAFMRLEKRLGGLTLQLAGEAIAENDVETACKIALNYYDKTYYQRLEKRELIYFCKLDGNCTDAELTQKVLAKSQQLYG